MGRIAFIIVGLIVIMAFSAYIAYEYHKNNKYF